jgi:hypothetical protein
MKKSGKRNEKTGRNAIERILERRRGGHDRRKMCVRERQREMGADIQT